ncbi:CPXCG motif-containing cysteine-rich protein [Bowmanella dokdonensis]|uniref:CPXCG motif-containing cysteine-rich protein n=1 Tax=Bowmanella dokdonensis TaxID=751969 RepID=A0A939IPR2_9ALTE|nr:CPXCG motif-containing cysteine-rich protein [Bowmanella dokdonensis]MBN7824264.1 CPXCG motif-containing cysteine-rich protein [Bowmanella dokdonensis]
MSLTQSVVFECPYCMTPNDLEVDSLHDLDQQQIVDCQICCQPIELVIREEGGVFEVQAQREDD